MNKGLNVFPGFCATYKAACFASKLDGPEIKLSNVNDGLIVWLLKNVSLFSESSVIVFIFSLILNVTLTGMPKTVLAASSIIVMYLSLKILTASFELTITVMTLSSMEWIYESLKNTLND